MLIERIEDSSPKSETIFIRKSASDGLFPEYTILP